MDFSLNSSIPIVRLRAFRAIDDPEACALFVEGHKHVLTSIGVEKVTSSKNEWTTNPAAFVLIVESLDKTKVYGGARIHIAGGTEALPIEQATGMLDASIFDMVWEYAQKGTGEICGLWNSREIAGYGIGSIFLTRAAVAISTQIGLQSLFALCAPYTVKLAEAVGYQIEFSIGNKGTFYYPKLDLLATTMILEDVTKLEYADEDDKLAILQLRNNPNQVKIEELRNKKIEINYDLAISNIESWDLNTVIANLKKGHSTPQNLNNEINIL
jgi:hypothetical protein